MTRPARSRRSLRRALAASMLAVGLVSGAALLAAPSYAAADEGPVVPGSLVETLNCDATPRGMTLEVTLGEGYEQPSGKARLQIRVNSENAVDELVTYPGTHSYFIPLDADGVYSYSLKVGGGSWIPSEVVTMPEDCASEPTPGPTPTSTATPAPTESPVPTSAPEPTATGTAAPSPAPSDGRQPASISLSASTVTPGSALIVSGRGYAPGETVEVWLHSTPVKLWSGTVSADGTLSRTVTIPDTTAPGSHRIEVRTGGGSISLNLKVTPGLAVTGIESSSLTVGGVLAALILAAGVSLMIVHRRATRI